MKVTLVLQKYKLRF